MLLKSRILRSNERGIGQIALVCFPKDPEGEKTQVQFLVHLPDTFYLSTVMLPLAEITDYPVDSIVECVGPAGQRSYLLLCRANDTNPDTQLDRWFERFQRMVIQPNELRLIDHR